MERKTGVTLNLQCLVSKQVNMCITLFSYKFCVKHVVFVSCFCLPTSFFVFSFFAHIFLELEYNYSLFSLLGRYGEFKFGATSLCVPPSLLKVDSLLSKAEGILSCFLNLCQLQGGTCLVINSQQTDCFPNFNLKCIF